jgi:hypothetical protein
VLRQARTLALVAFLAATTLSPALEAQNSDAAAARAFDAGSQAYSRGDFRAAAAAFDRAYDLAPRGAAAYNGGLSWEAAGDASRAADDYARALRTSDLGSVERADTTGRLKALEATVGRLTILAPEGAHVTLDSAEVNEGWIGVHVPPGRHDVGVRYPDGKQETRSVTVVAREVVEVRLSERTEPAPSPLAKTPEPNAPTLPAPPPKEQQRHPQPQHGADHALAFAAFGGAVVSSALAVYFYERGLSARDEFVQGGDVDASLRNQAETFRTLTWVGWGLAAVFAGTGAYLYFTTPKAPGAPTSLQLGPGRVSLHVCF